MQHYNTLSKLVTEFNSQATISWFLPHYKPTLKIDENTLKDFHFEIISIHQSI